MRKCADSVSADPAFLSPKQPDQESRNRGPPLSRAYEEDGVTPTKALLGFCKKNNVVNLDKELEKDDEYVWANVKTVGKSASEVMREELPKVVESIKFIKTMRWQLNEDNIPFFIKYGNLWRYNGFPKDQRTQIMKDTWEMVKGNYK